MIFRTAQLIFDELIDVFFQLMVQKTTVSSMGDRDEVRFDFGV